MINVEIRMCSSGTWRRVALRQQASKHWQRTAAAGDPPPCQPSRQQSRKERSSGKTRELAGAREQRPTHPPRTTTSSHAATAAGSAARGSVSTATAGAAAPPQTDHGCNSIVSRDRRTPTKYSKYFFSFIRWCWLRTWMSWKDLSMVLVE